jgi:hypothetical protein
MLRCHKWLFSHAAQDKTHEREDTGEQVTVDRPPRNNRRGDRKTEKVDMLCTLMGIPIIPLLFMPKRKAMYEAYLHGYTAGCAHGFTATFAEEKFSGIIFRDIRWKRPSGRYSGALWLANASETEQKLQTKGSQ